MTVISHKAKIEICQKQARNPYFLFLGKESYGRGLLQQNGTLFDINPLIFQHVGKTLHFVLTETANADPIPSYHLLYSHEIYVVFPCFFPFIFSSFESGYQI